MSTNPFDDDDSRKIKSVQSTLTLCFRNVIGLRQNQQSQEAQLHHLHHGKRDQRGDSPSHSMRIDGEDPTMNTTMKSVATGVAALGAIGAAAIGVTLVAPFPAGPAQVQLAAIGAPASGWYPQPQDPPPPPPAPGQNLPTPDQLSSLCTQVTDPGVSYTTKTSLVENGISPDEGHAADHDLRKAYRDGKFPEQFAVTNILPAGPNMAQADVAISGPKFAGPVTKHLVFVNQGGNWALQHDSALALLQAATS
jgi:hypothetical protein